MSERVYEPTVLAPDRPTNQEQLLDVLIHGLERFFHAVETLEGRIAVVLGPEDPTARLESISNFGSPFADHAVRLHQLVDRLESMTRRIEL